MTQATVYHKGKESGTLEQFGDGSFTFRYLDTWLYDAENPSISLTLPPFQDEHHAEFLFPFFYNMLPVVTNWQIECKANRWNFDIYCGILLIIARYDRLELLRSEKIKRTTLKIDHCPGTVVAFDMYSRPCLKHVFHGRKIVHILPYEAPNSNRQSDKFLVDNKRRISISGAQETFAVVIENNKLRLINEREHGMHTLNPYSFSVKMNISNGLR